MDLYTTSFVFPRQPSSPPDPALVQKLCVDITTREGCLVTVTENPTTFHLSGNYQSVMSARGAILRDLPRDNKIILKASRSDILESLVTMSPLKPEVRTRLDEIAADTRAHIAVLNMEETETSVGYGLETERMCELVVTGSLESVSLAKVRLLVLLDSLTGLHTEPCDIDYKLHSIIAGRKRHVIQSIEEETATNIYFPIPLVGIHNQPTPVYPMRVQNTGTSNGLRPPYNPHHHVQWPYQPQPIDFRGYYPVMRMDTGMSSMSMYPMQYPMVHGEQGVMGKANQIWITGEFFGVQRARDMLLNVAQQKSKLVISRDTAILPRKLDWLLTDRLEDVKTIMSDNGTYIQVPSLGSQASLITVFGDHRTNIERTIRSIMSLTCQFYVASFWLLPITYDVTPSLNPAQMQPILKRIASTGAEAVFKSNCFELHGLENEVRAAVIMILELDLIKPFHHEIRFQIELANEHRDFISGKKNGKINKVMKSAGVRIKFETFNDYNFLIDIAGSDMGSLQGLSMLQEELPAETSFHIPETYHKRIIGVGGKNIQRIMKLYGVYVKFSNAEEFAALGGYAENEDNVIARTPAKNTINLEALKQSVMEMVAPKDKDYTRESVSIPRRYHRTLLEKSIFIHDIERKTNCCIHFPYKETASETVTVFGPESQTPIATAMLLDHVPFEADLHLPPSETLQTLVTSPEFIMFTEKLKLDHQIAIVPGKSVFKFKCQRSNIDSLTAARDELEEFLTKHNVSPCENPTDEITPTDTLHFKDKLFPKRRATARTQSLDMTFSRAPFTPFLPTHNVHPNSTGKGFDVESVTQGLSNVQL